jgi:hypothetical protein
MNKLSDLSLKMQISGTEDIHVVPFVDFIKEASKIDSQAQTIRIGDNNYRLDNAEIGNSNEEGMEAFTAPVTETKNEVTETSETANEKTVE